MPLITFLIQAYIIFFIYKKVSSAIKNGENQGSANKNYLNSKKDEVNFGEFISSVSDAIKKSVKDNNGSVDSNKKSHYSNSNSNRVEQMSYKERPHEDYCSGSEVSYDLIEKQKYNKEKNSEAEMSLEQRLDKLEKDMDESGNYNISSAKDARKAVVYKEILDKKY